MAMRGAEVGMSRIEPSLRSGMNSLPGLIRLALAKQLTARNVLTAAARECFIMTPEDPQHEEREHQQMPREQQMPRDAEMP